MYVMEIARTTIVTFVVLASWDELDVWTTLLRERRLRQRTMAQLRTARIKMGTTE
jgi:hypothetical protein